MRTYAWGTDVSGSGQGAGGVGGMLATYRTTGSTGFYYPTFDGNGNVSEYLNDYGGGVVAHYDYDPFGNDITVDAQRGSMHDDFFHRFSTKYRDAETGLYYYGYRYFDPLTGRWMSKDPIGEGGGTNLYGFVGNDGMNDGDSLGLAVFMSASLDPIDPFNAKAKNKVLKGKENIRVFLNELDELKDDWFNEAMNKGNVFFNKKKYPEAFGINKGSKADYRKLVERESASTFQSYATVDQALEKVKENSKLASADYDINVLLAHGQHEWTNVAERKWRATGMILSATGAPVPNAHVTDVIKTIQGNVVWVSCLKDGKSEYFADIDPANGLIQYTQTRQPAISGGKLVNNGCSSVRFDPFAFMFSTAPYNPKPPPDPDGSR